MKFQDLSESFHKARQCILDHTRYYHVSDRMVACLIVTGSTGRRRRVRRMAAIDTVESKKNYIHVDFELTDAKNEEYYELGNATPAELMRLAEIKGTLEKWMKGEIDDLPSSTAAAPKEDPDIEI